MSIIGIITILIVIIFVVGIGIYLYIEHKEDVKDVKEIQKHRKNKDILLIDVYRVGNGTYHDKYHQYYRQEKSWMEKDIPKAYRMGYMEAEKWLDDLRYIGIKVFVRLHYFSVLPEPNGITSSVLYNAYSSKSVSRFINGITRINFNAMDMKTVGVLIPVAIGIVLGMVYFLGGGF